MQLAVRPSEDAARTATDQWLRAALTAQERQGLTRVLFAGSNPVQKRIVDIRRKRDHKNYHLRIGYD